jgi:hypothetical protein
VRFEDLLHDPVLVLRDLTAKIAPVEPYRITAAALLCNPEQLTRPGLVDPRHLRTKSTHAWAAELSGDIVALMSNNQPYASASDFFGYDWNAPGPDLPPFDYDRIDPFRGNSSFDNGEPIGPSLPKIYLHDVAGAAERWPDPTRTQGDSFWSWLTMAAPEAGKAPDFPPGTLTNGMMAVYRMRPDLQAAYPDPGGVHRAQFVEWFLGQAQIEFELPWGLIAPVQNLYVNYLGQFE